jgi:hypothetical protein
MNWQLLKHPLRQPFIVSTGVFAIVHSTWTIGTFFSGKMPSTSDTGAFALWLIPALLFAFSIDIGQIATAAEIRNGDHSPYKYATFILLALTTFYLQFLFMAHHMPALDISEGVVISQTEVTWLRNAAIWILPALMPLSTIFYTISSSRGEAAPPPNSSLQEQIADLANQQQAAEFEIACPHCEWQGVYDSERQATNALNAHKKHCATVLTPNGNGRH